jgi:hypothetical protein
MRAHELAKILLDCPNLPVATCVSEHVISSKSDDGLAVGLLDHYAGEHIAIGHLARIKRSGDLCFLGDTYLTGVFHEEHIKKPSFICAAGIEEAADYWAEKWAE